MLTQEQLDVRRQAANYIDRYSDRIRELDEIIQLQEQLTSRAVIVSAPMRTTSSSQPHKSIAERLAEQCAAKLASDQQMKPDVVKFLTAMSQAH